MNAKEKDVAFSLFTEEAIKFGEFRLKLHEKNSDAPLSPIYIDLRIMRSYRELMSDVVEVYENFIRERGLEFDRYADIPTAATPIVSILFYKTGIPMISPRKAKTHGLKGTIDGVFHPGETILLIDDLITKADSKLEAIDVLEQNKLVVKDIVVLVDREQGGKEKLEDSNYRLHTIYPLSALLQLYLDCDLINQERYNKVTDYLNISR